MEYNVNLSYRHSDPLVIEMPVGKARNLGTRLFPRGTAEVKREFKEAGENYGGYYIKEKVIYNLNYIIPEQKVFCVPVKDYYAHLWAKEALLNLAIAEAVQRELKDQKKPGGILNKYGIGIND